MPRRKEEPPGCFICGKVMTLIYGCEFSWKCCHCEVMEECFPEKYVSRVRTVQGDEFFGVTYLDHSAQDYPSPA